MVVEVAVSNIFQPSAELLVAAVGLDLLVGDPVYRLHPVRLIGSCLTLTENSLRKLGLDGYGGGILLFLILTTFWVGGTTIASTKFHQWNWTASLVFHLFLLYSLLALGDLLRHVHAVEKAAKNQDIEGARFAISQLVGRDTAQMDFAACRRAAIESLSENLTDGFTSPVFWYAVGGLPALMLFKVVSTMDSMVGYKNQRYLRFGWCGARLDDLMNLMPAILTWLLITLIAACLPRYSGTRALCVGWKQHSVLPGPNAGWSEAATAGALKRRLVGPIWNEGKCVTNVWVGDSAVPVGGEEGDVTRALWLITLSGLASVVAAIFSLRVLH